MKTFCCEIFFRTPCCCYNFYDTKHLESDINKMCRTNNVKLLMFTIENYHNNIDINYKYYAGKTLPEWARDGNHINVINLLEKYFSPHVIPF